MDHSLHHAQQIAQSGLSLSDRFRDFFSEYGFMPHGHCYLWKPWLMGIHVVSDLLIGLAYLSISITLYGLVKRTKIGFNRIVICFGVFIGACGITHFMEIWNLWYAEYWWSAWVKVITATASVFTGVYLLKLREPLIALADTARIAEKQRLDLEAVNDKLAQSLAASAEDFTAIANSIPQLAWRADPTGFISWYNQRWYDFTGSTLSEMQGWGWDKVHHPDHIAAVTEKWKIHLAAGKEWEDTFPLRSKFGEYRWFLSRAVPVRDKNGKVSHWFGTNTDITEQKNATEEKDRLLKEVELQKSRFEAVVNQMPAGVVVAEAPTGKLVYGSSRLREVWGYEFIPSENVENYIQWIGFHADGSQVQGHEWPLARSLQKGEIVRNEDFEILRGDGKRGIVRLSSAPIKNKENEVIAAVVVSQDVSEEFRVQRALKESEQKFKTIANAMPQMIFSTLPDGFHDYFNDQWYEFTGVPFGSTDGEGWLGIFHPDDQVRTTEVWENSLATGADYEIEYRLRHRTGTYRWVLGRALPIKNDSGKIIRWMGTCTDIHHIRETESKLKAAVSARDEFLSIASHELKTPLTALRLNTQVIIRQIGKKDPSAFAPEKIANYADQTLRQADRLNRLVDDMLDIARLQTGKLAIQLSNEDLVEIIRDVKFRMNDQFKNITGSELAIEAPASLKGVWDRLRLEQVITNLLTNALRYGNAQPVKVRLSEDGDNAHLEVIDRGIGIKPEQREKIFERFERADVSANDVSGLGLGLYIAKEIITSQRGKIWVESNAAGGSTFHVKIPRAN